MSKRAEEKAQEYEKSLDYYHYTSDNPSVAYQKGYEQAQKDILSLIESRLSELLGDAQPTLILRYELQDLIKKIKEDESHE